MACIYISSFFREHSAINCGAKASILLNFIFSFFDTPSMFSHIHYINVNLVDLKDKGQGEVHTRTSHVGPEGEQRHSSTLFNLSIMCGWAVTVLQLLYPWQRDPLHKRLGGPRASLDGCRKSRPPTGIQSLDHPTHSESLYRLCNPIRQTWWTYNLFSSQRPMT